MHQTTPTVTKRCKMVRSLVSSSTSLRLAVLRLSDLPDARLTQLPLGSLPLPHPAGLGGRRRELAGDPQGGHQPWPGRCHEDLVQPGGKQLPHRSPLPPVATADTLQHACRRRDQPLSWRPSSGDRAALSADRALGLTLGSASRQIIPLWGAIGLASIVCGGFMGKYFFGHTDISWSKTMRATYDHQGLSESRVASHNSHFGMRELNKKTFSIFPFSWVSMSGERLQRRPLPELGGCLVPACGARYYAHASVTSRARRRHRQAQGRGRVSACSPQPLPQRDRVSEVEQAAPLREHARAKE